MKKASTSKSLYQLSGFKFVTAAPTAISLFMFITIYLDAQPTFDLSREGFSYFFELYKYPLYTLSSIFPLVAIVASNHKSNQTAALITMQLTQNSFSNYYTHIKEFTEFYNTEVSSNITYKKLAPRYNIRDLHNILFPSSRNGNYELNSGIFNILTKISANMNKVARDTIIKLENASTINEQDDLIKKAFTSLSFNVRALLQENILLTKGELRSATDISNILKTTMDFYEKLSSFDPAQHIKFNTDGMFELYAELRNSNYDTSRFNNIILDAPVKP